LSDHPRPSPAAGHLSRDEIFARGACLERCFTTAHTGKCTWDTVFEGVRAATPARSFFAGDLGRPVNPPVEDGLALMADLFLAAGFTEEEVHTMAVANTTALARSTS
jgi:hypothetical protein